MIKHYTHTLIEHYTQTLIEHYTQIDNIDNIDNSDTVENAIKKFKNHRSVLRILEEGHAEKKFSFDPMSELDILIVINKIDPSKAFQTENIPPKVLKENADICSMTLLSDTNK